MRVKTIKGYFWKDQIGSIHKQQNLNIITLWNVFTSRFPLRIKIYLSMQKVLKFYSSDLNGPDKMKGIMNIKM